MNVSHPLNRPGRAPLPRCQATSKRRGEQCLRYATPGCAVCWWHGSAAPRVREKGAARAAAEEARRAVSGAGAPPVTDPWAELMGLAGTVKEHMRVLGERLDQLTDPTHVDKLGVERISAYETAYGKAMDRASATYRAMIALGLEERAARVEQRQADMLVWVLERTFSVVSPGEVPMARELAANAIREVVERQRAADQAAQRRISSTDTSDARRWQQ